MGGECVYIEGGRARSREGSKESERKRERERDRESERERERASESEREREREIAREDRRRERAPRNRVAVSESNKTLALLRFHGKDWFAGTYTQSSTKLH